MPDLSSNVLVQRCTISENVYLAVHASVLGQDFKQRERENKIHRNPFHILLIQIVNLF